ncbi:hypothetical protein HHI36_020283 [Cryptolaemus montrouzieri]|uniref:inositol-phosphate phosphatase n=1 Tax=Cryptolaemus montrouzieri TaxID=559131 RepID=A0ABD2NB06_9CUCU
MRLNKLALSMILGCIFLIFLIQRKKMNRTVNLKSLLKYAFIASERGGNAILKSRNTLVIKKKGLTKEGLEEKVTSADFRSHCTMVNTIKNKYPSLNIISEESDATCSNDNENYHSTKFDSAIDFLEDEWVHIEDITIWIDPLDATHEFTEKLYQYVTTMVCVALNGRPVIGVIHKPFQNVTSWAWVGKAKSYDLNSRSKVNNEKLRISISRSHSGKIREVLHSKLNDYELVVAAGAGYKSLQVAYGEVDAYLHATAIKKWDICAGNAIIDASGGQMTDKENNKIDYSRETSVVNENGLIGTLKDHFKFLGIL